MLLTVDSHFCSILCCSLWTMFRYGSLPRNATGQPQRHTVSLLCSMLFKPAIDGSIASTVLVPSGRHYSHYHSGNPVCLLLMKYLFSNHNFKSTFKTYLFLPFSTFLSIIAVPKNRRTSISQEPPTGSVEKLPLMSWQPMVLVSKTRYKFLTYKPWFGVSLSRVAVTWDGKPVLFSRIRALHFLLNLKL